MSDNPELTLVAKYQTADDLVRLCAEKRIPFSGSDDSLWAEFNRRGWSTKSLYEVVRSYQVSTPDK